MDEERLLAALQAMRDGGLRPAEPVARQRARVAMHQAVEAAGERGAGALILGRLRAAVTLRRTATVLGAAAVAGVAAIGVAGWSAPAGSSLHDVRLVREHIALAVPGLDHASLELSFVEDRLADARAGRDVRQSLQEASSLLADCRRYLPAAAGSPLAVRWSADTQSLARLEAALVTPGSTAGEGGGSGEEGSTPAQPGSTGGTGAENGGSGQDGEPSGGAAGAPATGDGEHGTSTTTSGSRSSSDGGSSEGGSGTSTSATSTGSDGRDGGGSDGGSVSVSTTSSADH